MRILAIHNYYQIRSGEDLAFDATTSILRGEGHEVLELTVDNASISKSSFMRSLLFARALFSLRSFFRTLITIRKLKPDVVLVQNVFPLLSPAVYLAAKVTGMPVVQRVFNYRIVCPNGVLFTRGQICERCSNGAIWNAVRFSCYRHSRGASMAMALTLGFWRFFGVWRWGVDLFLTPDHFLGQKILPAVKDQNKIHVIFNPPPESSLAVSQDHLSPSRNKDILFIGRLVKEKGIFTLVNCAELLPEHRFLVIGKGEEAASAKAVAEAKGLKNVEWLGAVYGDELVRHLRASGAIMVPSQWYDNMPLTLTQAMLAGIPIVASRINGIPEFILDNVTGLLASPGDAVDFAQKLRALLANPEMANTLSSNAQKYAKNWFGQVKHGRELTEALKLALHRK